MLVIFISRALYSTLLSGLGPLLFVPASRSSFVSLCGFIAVTAGQVRFPALSDVVFVGSFAIG